MFLFSDLFFFRRDARPAASMSPFCLIYLSTSNEAVSLPIGLKRLLIPGCVQGTII